MESGVIASATFRYVAFYDFLADATFQHVLASKATEPFAVSRHARASIIASALSVECIANCILESVDASKALLEELDKLQPLGKIDAAVRLMGIESFDRGRKEVQKAAELIRARNAYVHSKAVSWDAGLHQPQDGGADWMLPFSIRGERWSSLGIPKQASFWSHDASLAVLRVVCDFMKYVLVDVIKVDEEQLSQMLMSRLEFGNVLVPAVFDEFTREADVLKKDGIDFSFLKAVAGRK